MAGNSLETLAMSLSASRSGAKRFWSVCSTSNSQPMWAWNRPLDSPRKSLP